MKKYGTEQCLTWLREDVEELQDRVNVLEKQVFDLIEIMKPMAIGSEQLWEVVFNKILDEPVPEGTDVRQMANRL